MSSSRRSADAVLADLRVGTLTRDGMEMVIKAAEALGRSRRITDPSGNRDWSAEDVNDLVSDFFSKPSRLLDLAVETNDGAHLRAKLQTTLERLAIDRFRRTPVGTLRDRIKRRLRKRTDVADVSPRHWALVDHVEQDHWGGAEADLNEAVSNVPVAPPPWGTDADRESPATDTASLDAVCTRILDVAASPVERTTLLRVACRRILTDGAPVGLEVETDDGETFELPLADDMAEDAGVALVAEIIWNDLDDDERALLADLWVSSRVLEREGAFGLKHSAINARQNRLEAKLVDLINDLPERLSLVRSLLDLHDRWFQERQLAGHAPAGAS